MRNSGSARRALRAVEQPDARAEAHAAPLSRFDLAAAHAMAQYTPAEWALLEPSRRTQAIYAELRRVDLEVSPLPAAPGAR